MLSLRPGLAIISSWRSVPVPLANMRVLHTRVSSSGLIACLLLTVLDYRSVLGPRDEVAMPPRTAFANLPPT